jgi:hypothetical protein
VSTDLRARIVALLASLGETADDVADNLRARGLGGIREEGCHCPIANLLRAEFPEARESNGAKWMPGGDSNAGDWFVCQTYMETPEGRLYPPEPVRQFIDIFDGTTGALRARYADMERKGICVDCHDPLDAEELLAMAIRCDDCANAGGER